MAAVWDKAADAGVTGVGLSGPAVIVFVQNAEKKCRMIKVLSVPILNALHADIRWSGKNY